MKESLKLELNNLHCPVLPNLQYLGELGTYVHKSFFLKLETSSFRFSLGQVSPNVNTG